MGEGDEDLDEKLDRDRHGSGEYEPEERYGRRGVVPDRGKRNPADEDGRHDAPGEDAPDQDNRDEGAQGEDSGGDSG